MRKNVENFIPKYEIYIVYQNLHLLEEISKYQSQ